jgi:hypothetical protein
MSIWNLSVETDIYIYIDLHLINMLQFKEKIVECMCLFIYLFLIFWSTDHAAWLISVLGFFFFKIKKK